MAECAMADREIRCLEESLKVFNMKCLLDRLDASLEQVRRNMKNEIEHLDILKSANMSLLKLTQIYHSDADVTKKKSDREIADAQKLQAALSATRTVLQALTTAFLNNIDIHYKYEFFAKMDFSTLIDKEEMKHQIDYVHRKIFTISEVKNLEIGVETHSFLQVSRNYLRGYLEGYGEKYERYNFLSPLSCLCDCINGYQLLITECELTIEECRRENDENMQRAIQKIADQTRRELDILQKLERMYDRSRAGTLQIFPIYESADTCDCYYFVLPFVLYINVILMCSSMVNQKSGFWKKVKTFFSRKKNEKNLARTSRSIKEFKDALEKIQNFLEEEFDINTYYYKGYDYYRELERRSRNPVPPA